MLVCKGTCHLARSPAVHACRSSTRVCFSRKLSPRRMKYAENGPGAPLEYIEMLADASDDWKLDAVAQMIGDGGVGIIPTDTLYAFVCDVSSSQAVEKLYRIKSIDAKKPLSLLCRSLADVDSYTLGFPEGGLPGAPSVFRAVRQCLPGPYTFILPASKALPKQCTNFESRVARWRKSVGVRLPLDPICQALLSRLPRPLLCSSVKLPEDAASWMLDPVLMADEFRSRGLNFVVDGGRRPAVPSTVVDMTGLTPKVIRPGKGDAHPAEWEEELDEADSLEEPSESGA